jgi:hypothetical protein
MCGVNTQAIRIDNVGDQNKRPTIRVIVNRRSKNQFHFGLLWLLVTQSQKETGILLLLEKGQRRLRMP